MRRRQVLALKQQEQSDEARRRQNQILLDGRPGRTEKHAGSEGHTESVERFQVVREQERRREESVAPVKRKRGRPRKDAVAA